MPCWSVFNSIGKLGYPQEALGGKACLDRMAERQRFDRRHVAAQGATEFLSAEL
jgi:hypothetical protein